MSKKVENSGSFIPSRGTGKWDDYDSLKQRIFEKLGCTEEITYEFIKIALDDIQIFDRKQRDYGSKNISEFGEYGVLVRCSDKMERLKNLSRTDITVSFPQDDKGHTTLVAPNNEPIEDSWKDLSIYSIIARLCRKGLWPGE